MGYPPINKPIGEASPDRGAIPLWVKLSALAIGLFSSAFVICASNGIAPIYLDPIGKECFWAGTVFFPLLYVNRAALHLVSAKCWLAAMSVFQIVAGILLFKYLSQLSFLALFPIAMLQSYIFCILLSKSATRDR